MEEDDSIELSNFVFNDTQHQDSMLQALNMMRKNKHFCDVILHVGNTEIHAHRCVLASASPYLLELFTTDQDINRKSESIITYKLNSEDDDVIKIDKFAMLRLVEYAYTSQIQVPHVHVKSLYLAACQLKMDRVVQECIKHLIQNLSLENCIETRSLSNIERHKDFVMQVDKFIADNFDDLTSNSILLSLSCVQVEILNQTKQEMSFSCAHSLCHLVLDWIKRQITEHSQSLPKFYEKMHMLYLAMDNSLQDCTDLPTEDVSNTEIVQNYKKLSLKNHTQKPNKPTKKKCLGQPSKPRVLIYTRDVNVGEEVQMEFDKDWNLIASSKVAEHTFLALVTLSGHLTTLSIQLRLNPPTTTTHTNGTTITPPELISSTSTSIQSNTSSFNGDTTPPDTSDNESSPDLYCAVTPIPNGKCGTGCIGFNNDALIVCGGYDRVECLKTVEVYLPFTNNWLSLPQMREQRGRLQIAAIGTTIYALGGSNGHTELNSMEELDLLNHPLKWKKGGFMPIARSNHGVCVNGGKIFVVGGWNGQAGIKQCHTYDPTTAEWIEIAPLNTGRHQAGVTTYNNQVYAVGGTDNWTCLNTCEVYDPVEKVWTFTGPLNTQRRGCGACVFNNKLYVIGGSDGTTSLSSTEIYDLATETWQVGPSMTVARANVGVAVVDNRLYAVGGYSGKQFLNSIEYLDLNSNEWTTFIPKIKQPDIISPDGGMEINLNSFKYKFINGLQQEDNNKIAISS